MMFSEPREFARDPKFYNTATCHSRLITKLEDRFLSNQPTLSDADFHNRNTRNADSYLPKSFGSQLKCEVEGKAGEDELVRYMSNLPSYLEKGKSFLEKPLNIGVLDWRHLERWKYNNDPMPRKSSDCTSTSSTSHFQTEGISSRSSRGQSSSPARQRMHYSSLQSHLDASPMKKSSQDKLYSGSDYSPSPACQRTYHLVPQSHHQKIYPWESHSQNVARTTGGTDKIQEISVSSPNCRIAQQTVCGMDKTCRRNQSEVRLETREKKESVSNTASETGKWQRLEKADVVSSSKGNPRVQEGELKEPMQSRIPNHCAYHPVLSKEHSAVVLLVPKDQPRNRRLPQLSDSAVSANLKPEERRGRKTASRKDNYTDAHGLDLSSSVLSFPHPLQDDIERRLEMREHYSRSVPGVEVSSQLSKSPSRSKNTEEKSRIVVLRSPSRTHLTRDSDKRTSSESSTRARHSSPIRRLSSVMGSIIRSAGSRDNSPARRSCSKDPVTKPGSDRAAVSASSDTDMSPASYRARARSSPLRRLLDPLIKPKSRNVPESAEQLSKDFPSTARPWKSSDEHINLLKAQSLKVKSTITGCKTMGTKNSHQNVKKGPSPVHALLQVAVKNGLPLFTLAVDNGNDILAATLRKLSTAEKNRCGWIYTFFTVREMKKKNALWPPNQVSKGTGHYIPNVLAQMKVSDCQAPVRTKQKGTGGDHLREFTLFSVDVGHVDQNATEFQPTDELAAIVVKLPKATGGSPSDMSIPDSSNTLQDSLRSCIPLSTTVILPGGVHTVPSKGSISTLAQRWRSGGACDCGGWDLGCQLRIYKNQGDSQKSVTSSKTLITSDEFNMVGLESQLVLSLKPFKERIYSVEFDSSISLLQAFATCVAVLDCNRPSGLLTTSNLVQGRSSRARASVSGDPARTKPRNQSQPEAPASYVSYPPHSPAGRV